MEKEIFNRHLGSYVHHLRTQKGWTQPYLAQKMKNNAQNISRIERGEVSPTLYWISHLSEAFEMSLTSFVSDFDMFMKGQ